MAASGRLRSVTAASVPLPTSESFTDVYNGLSDLELTLSRPLDLSTLISKARTLRKSLEDEKLNARGPEAFRDKRGFHTLLAILRSTSGYYSSHRSHTEKEHIFDLLGEVFLILSAALRNEYGNRRYFKHRCEGGGWLALEQSIASIGFGGGSFDSWAENKLFGLLLSFALDNEGIRTVFQDIEEASTGNGLKEESKHDFFELVEKRLAVACGQRPALVNEEIIPTILAFWSVSPRSTCIYEAPATFVVLKALSRIVTSSRANLQAMHLTGALGSLLPLAFPDADVQAALQDEEERKAVESLCVSLMELGVSSLKDARYLVRSKSTRAQDFLLERAKDTHTPPHVHFDLSQDGYSCLEVSPLGRPFPPPSSLGYTFTAWIRIDQFDPDCHTTIFGILDTSQTCFVLCYLERNTHNFILQTSIHSSRPSVRFKSTRFKEGQWYHLALCHRRPKGLSSSRAILYIDGECVEQIKIQYPATASSSTSADSFASFNSSTSKQRDVQAFVGTPRDLATSTGSFTSSKWSLASAHLFDDILSDELIAVHHQLGPHYNGHFQDCLGSFQTYDASAALSMKTELLRPSKDDKSDIMTAIKGTGSMILAEKHTMLSILPTAIISESSKTDIETSQLYRGLSKAAANNLYLRAKESNGVVALNAAIPSMNEALTRANGAFNVAGRPILVVPHAIDDALWRLGGFKAIALKLVDVASSMSDILRAVELLFAGIKGSWRNSDAMERDNGYQILGVLLRNKLTTVDGPSSSDSANPMRRNLDQLSFQLLSLILSFVGYDHERPEDSIIINPLAYKTLIVDLDVWRLGCLVTQNAYYKQFVVFGVRSKSHVYNSKRLVRMRIVKKLLEALKSETFVVEVLPQFLSALESLVRACLSSEILRSLALYVTYALHKPSLSTSRTPVNLAAKHSSLSRLSTLSSGPDEPAPKHKGSSSGTISKKDLAIGVLQLYAALLCEKGNSLNLKKFATTVTNKWLLHLLSEDDPQVVLLGTKILARLLVINGSGYVNKFADKNGGFVIMRHRLRRWWDLPAIWPVLLSIMFNYDVAEIDFERSFDLFSLLDIFGKSNVVYPGVMPILTAMLQHGLNSLLHSQDDPDSPLRDKDRNGSPNALDPMPAQVRGRSMSIDKDLESRRSQPKKDRLSGQASVLHTVIRFLSDLHVNSAHFKDFTWQSDYVRHLLLVLYPAIVSTDIVSAETELNSRDSGLNFDGNDVVIRPASRISSTIAPVVRASTVETELESDSKSVAGPHLLTKAPQLRRGSSFILLTSRPGDESTAPPSPSTAKLIGATTSPKKRLAVVQFSNAIVEELLELVIAVLIDQVLYRKEFPGFGLFQKVPPGFQEHQAYFESYILRNTISHLSNTVKLDQQLLSQPQVITNMARFCLHIAEAVYEGWFMGGAEPLIDFAGDLLEHLQREDIAKLKGVRLANTAIVSIRNVFFRVALLRLSEIDGAEVEESDAVAFMNKLLYWQTVVLSKDLNQQEHYLKLICYQLYTKLVHSNESIQSAAADLWRILLVQKPEETSSLLVVSEARQLGGDFKRLAQIDNEAFLAWVHANRDGLDALFFGSMSRVWEDFANAENARTDQTAKVRVDRRKDRLKQWHLEDKTNEDTLFRHELASNLWRKNIYDSEHLKYQRSIQDEQEKLSFTAIEFSKMDKELRRPCAVFDDHSPYKWQLDRTEGRNRMRLRMLPDRSAPALQDYKPKRKSVPSNLSVKGSRAITADQDDNHVGSPRPGSSATKSIETDRSPENGAAILADVNGRNVSQEEFELVDDPNSHEDGYEDKNRKVIRNLQRGDQVEQVYNVSRIIGLESSEGLLILGKYHLYIIDNLFQRADNEIVNVWQAPEEERDPYLQMISGQKANVNVKKSSEQESRNWKWSDVLSISKRRFLFRDVAIEVFFTDGRSYLLTAISQLHRDNLFGKLQSKAPHTTGASGLPNPEDSWRLDALKVQEELPTGFGSKFGSIFNSTAWNPAMKKWAKGELSNFHYLMLVNTMAGRTFNDLTQYPVFPWVLADYTSEELDLDNPLSFRDLSKPMGAQHASRQADFIERYKSFAEMGDQPPFHYGTHYSSAMIVTSYLIRLQPFVQSYLLLQGGNFDHPDRLFFSIEKAWKSASTDNMTDVRELIPEFFYLPEFLTNGNGYNFGLRQGTGGSIDDVALPPWAKGDPKIFIAKHREALESPYVSRHLHQWIDLVFGSKQRGEAAIENVNVFHHLSYHGAKDLDAIEDQHERLATIGIIHNFGQTPHQVFSKPHQAREDARNRPSRLDTAADCLTKLPFHVTDTRECVASLIHSSKLDRLLIASPFRLHIGPAYDKYMDWGYSDNSVRFYGSDKKLLCLAENTHQGQISSAAFANSRTLITAGVDCVVSVWTLAASTSKSLALKPRTSLFAHKTPVTTIVVSRSFSTILSASTDGQVILWDLNRLEFVRKLTSGRHVECAQINSVTGDIMLCRGQKVAMYTLNGELILDQHIGIDHDDYIYSCAFYEGTGNEWLENCLVFTGHKRGVVNVWKKTFRKGKKGGWCLELIKRLDHVADQRSGLDGNTNAAITAIAPMATKVYTGDEDGKVHEWDCVQRER